MDKCSKARQRKAHHRRSDKKQGTLAQELKKLWATENLPRMYRNIKYVVGKDTLAGITLVIAPNSQGDWVKCTSKDKIENACISEAQRRIHQTKGTPPMTPPLNIQLGYMGIGDNADWILDGQYESKPGTDRMRKYSSNHSPESLPKRSNSKAVSQQPISFPDGKRQKKRQRQVLRPSTLGTAKRSLRTGY
jgi:hypothetical protein